MKHWTVYVCIFLIIYTCLHVHGFACTGFSNMRILIQEHRHVQDTSLTCSYRFPLRQCEPPFVARPRNDRKMWEDITTDDEDTDISRFQYFFWIEMMEGHDEINARM